MLSGSNKTSLSIKAFAVGSSLDNVIVNVLLPGAWDEAILEKRFFLDEAIQELVRGGLAESYISLPQLQPPPTVYGLVLTGHGGKRSR